MYMKKNILSSIILLLAGVYTAWGQTKVAETGGTQYESLQSAITNAADGGTITLLTNIDLGSSSDPFIIIGKAVTIDGGTNLYEIKGTGSDHGDDTEATIVLQGSGDVTLKNLKVTNPSNNNNGVGIKGTTNSGKIYSGKLTIDNCEITVPMRGVNVETIAAGFSMDITASTIQSNVADPTTTYINHVDSRGISFSDNDELATEVTITNTTIQGFKNDIYVGENKKNLKLTMNGVKAYGLYMLNLSGENSTVNLNGGTTFSACTGGCLVTDETAYTTSTNIIYLDEATKNASANNVLNAVSTLNAVGVGSGKYKLEAASAATGVAQIGNTKYATLQAAVDAANAGETIKVIVAGNYTLPNLPKNITIEGSVDGVVFNHTTAGSVASIPNGATFKNVEFNFGNVNYHGFQHAGTINMEGCTLNGKLFSYGDMNFTDCSFNQSNSDYHMWAYSGNLTYTGCTFTNTATGKFINVYNESGTTKYTVTATNCKFVNQASSSKAALNVKATSGSNLLAYDVIINNCTTEGAFPEASTSDALVVLNSVVQVDDRPSGADNITVTQDGVLIYPVPEKSVAQIGTTGYPTLQAAVDAAKALGGEVTINIIDDISGETVTIQEVANFKLTIDGQKDASSNYTVDATIVVDGLRSNGGSPTNGASVKLQNIAFVKTTATDGIQASHYAHNLTIQDCTYYGFDNDKWFLTASVDGPLYGVTVKNVTVEHARLIYGNLADDAVFQNITATTDCKVGFNVKTSGTALIENCQVTTGKYAFRDYNDGYTGTFTLKDNIFVSTSTESDEGVIVNRGGAEGTAHINVESGTYIGALKVLNNKKNVLVISGGQFSAPVGNPEYAGYFAEGLCGVNGLYEGDAPNGVGTAVASITTGETTIKFATFEAAVDAATSGETIELLANITDAYTMSEGQTLKVKKNGFSVTIKAPEGFILISSTPVDGVITYTIAEPDLMYTATNGTVSFKVWSNTVISNSGTYKLLKDVTASARIVPGISASNVTLDLNGFTLTSTATATDAAFYLSRAGTATSPKVFNIVTTSENSGGKVVVNPEADKAIEIYGNYNNVTIGEGVTIDGGCVAVLKNNDILTVEGTINGGDDFAIVTNGGTTTNATITIKDGAVLTSNSVAMYLPGTGTTTIEEGAKVTGTTGIYVKSATLNIEGGEITGNGPAADYSYNNNGCNSTGQALVVDNCNYPGGAPTVNITGGKFTTANNESAIGSYAHGDGAEAIGEFVHGGYFSTELPREICEAGKRTVPSTTVEGYYELGNVEYVAQIDETHKYETLQAALDAAHEMTGDVTVTLLTNIAEYAIVHQKAGLNLTIDGAEKTIAGQIFIDGNGRASGTETLTIKNVKFEGNTSNFYSGTDAFILVPSTKETDKPWTTGAYNYAHNITVTDCSFTSTSTSDEYDVVCFKATSGAGAYNVAINNCTASGTKLHSLAQLTGTTGGAVTNCTVTGSESFVNVNGGGGNFTISGNSFTSAEGADGYGIRENGASSAVITLSDNTFTAASAVVMGKGTSVTAGTINVESGVYTGAITKTDAATGKIAISDGYFSVEFPDEYIAEALVAAGNSCVPAADMEGYFTVGIPHYVAQIGETKYISLAKAIEAVIAGTETTIIMIDDETIVGNAGVTIPDGKKIILDLNGKIVKGVVQDPTSAQTILNKGTLTITDSSDEKNGTITNEVSDENAGSPMDKNWYSNVITNNGTLTVNAGNIVNTGTGGACYAIDNITNGTLYTPVLNIAGGNISAKKVAVRMFCNSTTNDNTVNVTGGVITSENAYAIQAQQANNNANKAKLTISGGTLSGQYAFCDYGNKNVATQFDNASYSITGGFFSGDMWSYATYYCGMDGFVSGGYFSNEIGGDIVAPGKACVENTDEATKEAYPYTIGQADIYYYWLDNNGQINGGGYYTIYAPFAGPDPVLMDGEFIELQRNVTLTKDIEYIEDVDFGDPIFKGGTFTLTFGQYNINLNGFHFPIPTGVTILTDKQTNIFSALEEGYEVVEETTENGYAYSVKKSIANPSITIIVDPATYNGTAQTPVVTIKDGTTELVEGTDYTISYKGGTDNSHLVNADTYVEEIVITGKGNYGGMRYADFIIAPRHINDVTVSGNNQVFIPAGYSTDDIINGITLSYNTSTLARTTDPTNTKDYTVSVADGPETGGKYITPGIYAGVITLTAEEGEGKNFVGTRTIDFIIGDAINIADCDITATTVYNGVAQNPTTPPGSTNVVVKNGTTVVDPSNYQITYIGTGTPDYINASTYAIRVSAASTSTTYYGSKDVDYVINPKSITSNDIVIVNETTFAGTTIDPVNVVQVKDNAIGDAGTSLVKGTDYNITTAGYTYQDPQTYPNALTITGIGNYTGTVVKDFIITPNNAINLASAAVVISKQTYTGADLKPTAATTTVTVNGTALSSDYYDFSFVPEGDNFYKDAKVYSNAIIITAKSTQTTYYGTAVGNYIIEPRDLSDNDITVTTTDLNYLNTEQDVTVEVKYGNNVIPATNYTYTPEKVTEAGKHIITINAVENSNLVGSTTAVQWVYKSLDGDYAADFSVEPDPIPTQNWTGEAIKPTIVVKDKDRVMQLADANEGDYSIAYSNNIDEGEATITITGTWAYSGTITKHFTIVKEYFTVGDFTYHHAKEGEEVNLGNTDGTNNILATTATGKVEVPETVDYQGKTFTVTGIEEKALGGEDITAVVLPQSIAEIEDNAFLGAVNTRYVDASAMKGYIPETLTRDFDGPFGGLPKQALVYLTGTNIKGENYVYKPGDSDDYYCELFKIYDDFNGSQTGFSGNDYKWAFENPHTFTAYTLENTRMLTAGKHYTTCLPYSINIPKNMKAYTLDATSDQIFGFKEVIGTIDAYTPYVLIPTASGQLLSTTNVEIPVFPADANVTETKLNGTVKGNFTFYGSMRYMEGNDAAGKYIMQYNNGNPTWKKIIDTNAGFTEESNKACVLPMRAYIINEVGGSREFFEVIFTNIDGTTIALDKLEFDDQTIYDLSGRKVQNLEHGHTYIINGKKIMIK